MITANQLISQILLNTLSFQMPTRIAKRMVDSYRTYKIKRSDTLST